MKKTRIQSLDWEDPLEKEMATDSVFLPGESHGLRNLADCSSWGHKRVGHILVTKQQQKDGQGVMEKEGFSFLSLQALAQQRQICQSYSCLP